MARIQEILGEDLATNQKESSGEVGDGDRIRTCNSLPGSRLLGDSVYQFRHAATNFAHLGQSEVITISIKNRIIITK